tara:strand:+ start:1192 stop:1770 length:579 start_codon:yes stop_codon:yes gene_type:complete
MEKIKKYLYESAEVKRLVGDTLSNEIARAVDAVYQSIDKGGKVLLMGNGGSAGDAQHIAAELVGRYKLERKALPAIALTVDTSAITAIGNDYGYDLIFDRQVEALCLTGDVVVAISTSGNSENIIRALERARKIGARTIALLGKTGGGAKNAADIVILIPSDDTARIQETHITIGHIICELVEKRFADENKI